MKYIVVSVDEDASDSPAAIAEWIGQMLDCAQSYGARVTYDPAFNSTTQLGEAA